MSDATFHPRLAELAHRLVQSSLTSEEHAELEKLLEASPAARNEYFLLLDLEYGLAQLAEEEHDRRDASLPEPVFSGAAGADLSTRSYFGQYGALLALGLSLLLAVTLFFWQPASELEHGQTAVGDDNVEMQLAQSARSRFFGEGQSPAIGDALVLDHDYALVEGSVQLRSRTGAEMIVQAPAVFSIQSAERVTLKVGSCSVYAPDGAEGFRVLTPQAEVVDKGTRFSVHVAETGEADIEVIEGAAELLTPAKKVAGLTLSAGEGRVVNSLGEISGAKADQFGKTYQATLPDRLVRFDVSDTDNLESIDVQRGGRLYQYDADQLIGFDLIHFHSARNTHNMTTPIDQIDPREGDRSQARSAYLDRDRSLCTGLLNPGGSVKPLSSDPDMTHDDPDRRTPGLGIRFHHPVVNGPGPDVVFFDLHVVVHPEQGDPFHVSPTRFGPGLHSHTIRQYDISLADRTAHTLRKFRLYDFEKPIRGLEQLETLSHNGGVPHAVPAKVIAVGIDLSDLGYPDGAEVDELFFQDILDDDNYIDPVFLGGLPPLPRPSSLEK
ncbi:FecR domain-containing protein [Blastopirellula marina]|uniref:FecR protein domain-containing protein n=1 Tax=Blastopirellula marina TaxID=124 RepID=A0A2S8GM33_9BACT|nr:hypothetical protein [Blastopirellula marina]PQO45381.1 hypothetical protein C5Y93_13085 [Blastopirellula marina]